MSENVWCRPATRFRVIIDVGRCKGCGLCVAHCPKELLCFETALNALGYRPVVFRDDGSCTGCGNCYHMCPECIVRVERV